jgi:hypothetical protein
LLLAKGNLNLKNHAGESVMHLTSLIHLSRPEILASEIITKSSLPSLDSNRTSFSLQELIPKLIGNAVEDALPNELHRLKIS